MNSLPKRFVIVQSKKKTRNSKQHRYPKAKDSIGKKIKVVAEVAAALGLKNVTSEHHRAEHVSGTYDFIISRAVTKMAPFIEWIKDKININHFNNLENGILYLKGGDLEVELAEAKRKYVIYDLSDFFDEEFFLTKKVVYVPF